MEVTLAQADALRRLRASGIEFSNLRPRGRAVVADTRRRGLSLLNPARGTVIIQPGGDEWHAIDALPEQRAS